MRLAFFVLLLINLVLFAWQRGVFGVLPEDGREPERSAQQIAPERIRVLTHDDVQQLREKAKDLPAAAAAAASAASSTSTAATAAAGEACVQWGDFSSEAANRAAPMLAALNLGDRLVARPVDLPGWFMVYIPPLKSRADVDRRAEELKKRGVKDLLVIADNSPMRFGISLGAFRDRDLAQKHRADLEKRGVKDVRVADTPSNVSGMRFLIRGLDTEQAQQLAELQKEFPNVQVRPCVPD